MLLFYESAVETDEKTDKITYVYENYYSFMTYAVEKIMIHSKHDVEDIVHSAIIRIMENIDIIDFSDDRRVKNLCVVIARNLAIDYCKKKDNQNICLDDAIDYDDPNNDVDPLKALVSKDTYEVILRVIDSLDSKYRDVCSLRYINGLKEKDIARLLDIPRNTVGIRLYRAKRKIKEKLEKENIDV